ncbi:MAG: guanylate kinase [Alphaproteobacteria bacterium]|nr:guanylate kinase [Alphaproteobacteria bacterium]
MKSSFLFVISGPSGVGKSTVANGVLKKIPEIDRIVTCTSRCKRYGETDGVDYYFISKNAFFEKIGNNEFVEYAEVYGNYYGVLFSTIEESFKKQQSSLLVINWEGFFKIKKNFPDQTRGIFINPPTFEELENRIRGRHSDSEESIVKRLQEAERDMSYAKYYDFVVKNKEIDSTVASLVGIIREVIQ